MCSCMCVRICADPFDIVTLIVIIALIAVAIAIAVAVAAAAFMPVHVFTATYCLRLCHSRLLLPAALHLVSAAVVVMLPLSHTMLRTSNKIA